MDVPEGFRKPAALCNGFLLHPLESTGGVLATKHNIVPPLLVHRKQEKVLQWAVECGVPQAFHACLHNAIVQDSALAMLQGPVKLKRFNFDLPADLCHSLLCLWAEVPLDAGFGGRLLRAGPLPEDTWGRWQRVIQPCLCWCCWGG